MCERIFALEFRISAYAPSPCGISLRYLGRGAPAEGVHLAVVAAPSVQAGPHRGPVGAPGRLTDISVSVQGAVYVRGTPR